jgi:hypothetical protein
MFAVCINKYGYIISTVYLLNALTPSGKDHTCPMTIHMLCAGPDLSGVYLSCHESFIHPELSSLESRHHQIIHSVCFHDVVSPDGLDSLRNVGQSIPSIYVTT